MPVDNEKIKQAIDAFEEDEFMEAKDILKKEIQGALHDYTKDKLDLEKSLGGEPEAKGDDSD